MTPPEVRGQFWGMCELPIIHWLLTQNSDLWPRAYSLWPQEVIHAPKVTSDLMHTQSWPYGMTSQPQNNFKAVLIFINQWVIIDCHTPAILQQEIDKLLNYLIKRECWPKSSYFCKLEAFFKLFTSFWYTLWRISQLIAMGFFWKPTKFEIIGRLRIPVRHDIFIWDTACFHCDSMIFYSWFSESQWKHAVSHKKMQAV